MWSHLAHYIRELDVLICTQTYHGVFQMKRFFFSLALWYPAFLCVHILYSSETLEILNGYLYERKRLCIYTFGLFCMCVQWMNVKNMFQTCGPFSRVCIARLLNSICSLLAIVSYSMQIEVDVESTLCRYISFWL